MSKKTVTIECSAGCGMIMQMPKYEYDERKHRSKTNKVFCSHTCARSIIPRILIDNRKQPMGTDPEHDAQVRKQSIKKYKCSWCPSEAFYLSGSSIQPQKFACEEHRNGLKNEMKKGAAKWASKLANVIKSGEKE